ncbi:hypothetical protein CC117_11900 [Parafrankia colletiae]|uniref:Uncharacterized protein n=1 Tax=Parafrankia colletiae TaxID=573497 RepID=A0A1S1RBX8_9ACTN|nr:hypothetical protein [Parafrankia colletiae]MCK9900776.1 hypothetical protein [Frankia sp. Cpl3]OHV42284.1 hypothetical protein CC117_11900 [Parafrankia colletiae]
MERRLEVTDVRLPLVSFRYTYRFLSDGVIVTSDSTLRFRGRDEIAADLATHGYSGPGARRRDCCESSARSAADGGRWTAGWWA